MKKLVIIERKMAFCEKFSTIKMLLKSIIFNKTNSFPQFIFLKISLLILIKNIIILRKRL